MAQRRALGGKVEVCPIIVGLWQLGGGHGRIGTQGVDGPRSVDVDMEVAEGAEETEGALIQRRGRRRTTTVGGC